MTSVTRPTTSRRHGTWHSFDVQYERLRLFSPWAIVGFGLAISLGLFLVYPHKTLEQRLVSSERSARPDSLTIEYLKAFLKADPTADSLRLSLLQQLIQLGSYDEARRLMLPWQADRKNPWHLEAAWLELQIREQETFAEAAGSPRYLQQLALLHDQLRAVLQFQQSPERLILLGQKALAVSATAVASAAFQRLVASQEVLPSDVYAQAALVTLGLRDYRSAAALYFRAMRQTKVRAQQRAYFLEALRTLQAGGLMDEALTAADNNIGVLANDPETLLFLARLAQAANKLDAAERYAKQLLRLSLLERWRRTEGVQLAHLQSPRSADAIAVPTPAQRIFRIALSDPVPAESAASGKPGAPPALPFDDEAYTLSFNIFLANRNLTDARRVAESAVQQRPENPAWRKRLAEISEWTGEPVGALVQWLSYARLSGDEKAWDAALRLSASLYDLPALQAVLEHKLVSDPRNKTWLDQLLALYEADGKPERALQLLRSRLSIRSRSASNNGAQRQRELELLGNLATRTGRDDEALATLRTLQTEYGPASGYALKIANILYRRGKFGDAFAALQPVVAANAPGATDFWRAYAELARLLQNDDAAQIGYRHLLESDTQSPSDLSNLIALLDAARPQEAALLAEYAFARTGDPRFATQALVLHQRLGDRAGAQRFLSAISAAQAALLETNARFLSVRAATSQAGNDFEGAQRDMRAALRLQPDDADLRAGLIWLAIARRDTASLKRSLTLWGRDAETSAGLWGPFAAANMVINRQDQALHWFRKSGFVRDDYLWLMSYAECLDANGQAELAWNIRRKVWQDLRNPDLFTKATPEQLLALRDRLAALAPRFMSGDGAQQLMQALLRADVSQWIAPPAVQTLDLPSTGTELLARLRQIDEQSNRLETKQQAVNPEQSPWLKLFAPGDGQRPRDDARLSASVRELARSYAMNREANDLARAWLATRFAGQLAKPLWAELSLILASNDRARLDQVLDDIPDWLPMFDRIEAAERAGRPALAQNFAFEQLALLPQNDDLHQRFVSLTTDTPAYFQSGISQIDEYPLHIQQTQVAAGLDLTPGLKLTLELTHRNLQSSDATALSNLPAHDNQAAIVLRKQLETGSITTTLQQRQASAASTGLRMDYEIRPTHGLNIAVHAGINQLATESAALRAGAMRSGVQADVNVALSQTEYFRIGAGMHRYTTQSGTRLGSGHSWDAEIGTHLQLGYPNVTLRGTASGTVFSESREPDARFKAMLPVGTTQFLPVGSTIYGLSLGAGTMIENKYSRAWRPFMEAGVTYTRYTGRGFNARAGFAGSVMGQDLLMLRAQRNSGTSDTPQGLREVGLTYQWFD